MLGRVAKRIEFITWIYVYAKMYIWLALVYETTNGLVNDRFRFWKCRRISDCYVITIIDRLNVTYRIQQMKMHIFEMRLDDFISFQNFNDFPFSQ